MILDTVAVVLLLGGAFFLFVSTLGLIRLPDFLSRTHAVGKSDTLGSLLVLLGLAFFSGVGLDSAKLLLIVGFIAVTNPTGIHTLARAALRTSADIWVDDGEPGAGEMGGRSPDAQAGPGGAG